MVRQIVIGQKFARFAVKTATRRNQHRIFCGNREYAAHAAVNRKIAHIWPQQIDIARGIEGEFFALAFENLRSHTQVVFGAFGYQCRIVFELAITAQIILHKARQPEAHYAVELLLERYAQRIFQRPSARRVERIFATVIVVVVVAARYRIDFDIAAAKILEFDGVRYRNDGNVVVSDRIFGNLTLFFVAKTDFVVVVEKVIDIAHNSVQVGRNVVGFDVQRLVGVQNVVAVGDAAALVVAEIVEHHHALRRVTPPIVTAPQTAVHHACGLVGILSAPIDEIDQTAKIEARIGVHREKRFEMVLLIECGQRRAVLQLCKWGRCVEKLYIFDPNQVGIVGRREKECRFLRTIEIDFRLQWRAKVAVPIVGNAVGVHRIGILVTHRRSVERASIGHAQHLVDVPNAYARRNFHAVCCAKHRTRQHQKKYRYPETLHNLQRYGFSANPANSSKRSEECS